MKEGLDTDDEYRMPFGKHKGECIGEVPASYLLWLAEQDWIEKWGPVKKYIDKKYQQLEQEAKR